MGRGRKGVLEQSYTKQKKHREQQRPSNSYAMVGGLSVKPSYVDKLKRYCWRYEKDGPTRGC